RRVLFRSQARARQARNSPGPRSESPRQAPRHQRPGGGSRSPPGNAPPPLIMALELMMVADLESADTAGEASLPRAGLQALHQERIVLISSRPAPPGAPLLLHCLGRTFEARTKG